MARNILKKLSCCQINCKTFKIQKIKLITCWTKWALLSLHTCKHTSYLFKRGSWNTLEHTGTHWNTLEHIFKRGSWSSPSLPASLPGPRQRGGRVRKGRSRFQTNLNLAKPGWLTRLLLPPRKLLLWYQCVSPGTLTWNWANGRSLLLNIFFAVSW